MKASSFALLLAMVMILPWAPQLARAASDPPPGAASCAGCHPARAASLPGIPSIDGHDAGEILSAMMAFRDGTRPSTIMGRIAKGFSDQELRSIAAWLAAQKQGM